MTGGEGGVILAIETATEAVGVAVADGNGPRAAAWAQGRRRHAESLGPMVAEVCGQAGVTVGDLEVLAVDVGPGLFTGLRVGVAMANALALSRQLPVLGFESLEILAQAALECGWPGQVLAVVDARRAQVFAARYRAGTDGSSECLWEPARLDPESLGAALDPSAGQVLAVGDGARRYRRQLEAAGQVTVAGPPLVAPPPATLAALAGARARSLGTPPAGVPVLPHYLRAPDVKVGWARRGSP